MQSTDRREFVRTLNGVAAIKGKELTAEAIDVWWAAMARWPLEEFKAAASHLVSSCKFMPTPFDFEELRRAGQPTAGEAWVKVVGGAPLEPGSRIARAAAIVGGQRTVRMSDIERDLPHIQRRFMEAYDELTDVDSHRQALPFLDDPFGTPALTDFGAALKVMR